MSAGACAVCGGAEPFGVNLCARCGAAPDAGDTLVVVCATADGAERADRHARLDDLLGDPAGTRSGRDAGAGRRALVRVPGELAPRIVERLESTGVPARTLAAARAWTLMPAHFFVMIVAILGSGMFAGMAGVPAMRWTAPLLATMLLLAAQRSMLQPLLGNARHVPRIPAAAAETVRRTFAELGDGAPRRLLADVVRIAQPVFAGAPRTLSVLLSDLLVAACATALETERQGAVLAVLRGGSAAGAIAEAERRCARSREEGLALLDRAATALAQLGIEHSAGDALPAGHEPLAELVHALEREAQSQAEAARELELLLRG